MAIDFYYYPNCGTCKKAKKWLEENDVSYNGILVHENPPTKEEMTQIYKRSGLELKKFFNTSGQKYRELGMKDKMKETSEEELLEILVSDGMLIKRPLTVGNDKVTVGFKEEEYKQTWA